MYETKFCLQGATVLKLLVSFRYLFYLISCGYLTSLIFLWCAGATRSTALRQTSLNILCGMGLDLLVETHKTSDSSKELDSHFGLARNISGVAHRKVQLVPKLAADTPEKKRQSPDHPFTSNM